MNPSENLESMPIYPSANDYKSVLIYLYKRPGATMNPSRKTYEYVQNRKLIFLCIR